MILPCPACKARFMVPDERITPKGIKIRCPKCRFVFIMKAQKKAAAAAGPPATASGSIGGATAASGAIGGAEPAPRKKPAKRRAPTEQEVAGLSPEELAALEQEEIVDMDDLAQATEQSGTAFNPNIKQEHFQLPGDEGPSVMIDDSLLSAAADHKATWTEEPTASEHVRRIDPNQLGVSDTWIDLPGSETPTPPMGIRALAAAPARAPEATAAPEPQAAAAPEPEVSEPAGPTEPMAVPPAAASGELGAAQPAPAQPAPEPDAAPPAEASGELGAAQPAPEPEAAPPAEASGELGAAQPAQAPPAETSEKWDGAEKPKA